jgi:hypothetical protein
MDSDDRTALRPGLRWLSRALIVYGIIGLIVTAIACGALVWANNRVTTLRGDAETAVARAAGTLDLTAVVLRGASTTVTSFSGTVDQSAQAVSAAATTITETRSSLSALEAQLRSVNILGATPLAAPADAVGRINASMDGLDGRLSGIAASGTVDRDALASNATALGNLADSTHALAASFDASVANGSFSEVQMVIAVTLLAVAAWSFVPAIGALVLGVWLGRRLSWRRSGSVEGNDQPG